jgi:Transglycosylase SLT domain/SPOR domain
MMRVSPAPCLFAALGVAAPAAQAAENLAVASVEAGIKAAGLAAAGPKPFVDIVCPIMQQQSESRGLPPMAFVRLIWRESRFNPSAVSPKGAQGIAQFMPGTAIDRGLDNPFEPKSAIMHSASLLADLLLEFGNFGRAAAEWKLAETDLPATLKAKGQEVQDSCRKLAPLVVRAVYETEPLTASGAWRPWGVHVSTAFSKSKALAEFARIRGRYSSILGQQDPFVLPERNLSRGRGYMYMVQIGADSRAEADTLCNKLRASGGACIVQKN